MTRVDFLDDGWAVFPYDPALAAWVDAVLPVARAVLCDPAHARWFRYRNTWFAGVNVLDNDGTGAIADSGPVRGCAVDFVHDLLGCRDLVWDRAQVSVCFPGYPQPAADETAALHRFRRDRDAAHVDGLVRAGAERRRFLREHHGFILGIPMVPFGPEAAPFVVWRGSHHQMRAAFEARFAGIPSAGWSSEDITETYHAVRKRVFECCERVPLHARPGEAFVVHRLALHGMERWQDGADAGPDGRMILYFRPEIGGPRDWLSAP